MKTYRSTCLALLIAGLLSPLTPVHADPAANREFQTRLNQAMQGDADAQYRIGEMYEQGLGTGKDPAMAYLWYTKAANSGNARAKDKLAAAEKADANEQSRVNGAMRALQQQSVDQDNTAAKQKAAADARRVQQDEAARLAREKAAAAAAATAAAEAATRARAEAAAKARADAAAKAAAQTTAAKQPPKPVEPPKPAAAVVAAPAAARPAPAPAPKTAEAEKDEFKANPCKGPQAKFLSTCN